MTGYTSSADFPTTPGAYDPAHNTNSDVFVAKFSLIPVTGSVGVFRNATHMFFLKNGSVTTSVNWGVSTDIPVTGDWNWDGLYDVGAFRPATHMFYLKNGSVSTRVNWGKSTDMPVTGKWS